MRLGTVVVRKYVVAAAAAARQRADDYRDAADGLLQLRAIGRNAR